MPELVLPASVVRADAMLVLCAALLQTRARSWLAFSQHYALGAQEREAVAPAPDNHAFAHPEPYVRGAFGESHSILAAATAKPTEIDRHAAHNLTLLPRELAAAVLVTPTLLTCEAKHPDILDALASEDWELAAAHPVVSLFRR